MSLEEETNPDHHQNDDDIITPVKPPRRGSLAALGIFAGRNVNQEQRHTKRRSSIAEAILGRSHKSKQVPYETAVISEKSDATIENDVPSNGNGFNNNYSTNTNDGGGEEGIDELSNDDKLGPPVGEVKKELQQRRRSFALTKQRRRKSLATTLPDTCGMPNSQDDLMDDTIHEDSVQDFNYPRQKRNSWWNIFVPDHLKQRSRRASQADVGGILAHTTDPDEVIAPVYRRSKSRSVDHGLAAPFDLDSLRSKVEGRFDSVERLSKDGAKKSSLPSIPTTTYTVGNRDTLTSVAARFDTTPSELSQINKLHGSFIYPGQQLLVPDKKKKDQDGSADDRSSNSGRSSPTSEGKSRKFSHEEEPIEEKELLEGLRPVSPKPGHTERILTPNQQRNEDDPVITQRFLKINVRHITDGQGVVGGVLLVTPNAVMFDPNVSDPLVIEHGPEHYGVIAPMELVVNAAIFHDIAHMRVGENENTSLEKVEVYYPKQVPPRLDSSHSPGKDSLLVKDETFPELGVGSVDAGDDQESVSCASGNERECAAFPKAFERDLVTPTNLQKSTTESTEKCAGDKIDEEETKVSDEQKTDDNDTNETHSIITKTDDSTTAKTDDEHSKADLDKTTEDSKDEGAKSKDEDDDDALNKEIRSLDERRKSLLDQHWAIPSKDSQKSFDNEKSDDGGAEADDVIPPIPEAGAAGDAENQLEKQSYRDSGIDIRGPIPIVQPSKKKETYSDADLVLSNDWTPPLTIGSSLLSGGPSRFQTSSILGARSAAQSQNLDAGGRKKTSSVSFSIEDNDPRSQDSSVSSDKPGEKKNKMLKRLSYPLAWVEGLTGEGKPPEPAESAPNTGDSNQSVFSKVFSRRSSIGTFIRPLSTESSGSSKPKVPPPKLDYRSMVSIDDMPELFVSFDKLIPRPARACRDPPLYLRLRMGRPIGKEIPLPTSVMSYGKNKLRPEYWFSIPRNRVDGLYRFINSWVPQLYGDLDEEKIATRGYELIQHDTEWTKGSPNKDGKSFDGEDGENITEFTRESWQCLEINTDDYRKSSLFTTGSLDLDFPIPDLIGKTEILTEEHREKLCGHLPARAEGYSWSLVFTTSQHGFSLNSLYRKMHRLESPILIVIEDTDHNVFGALTSCSMHVSDHFYGTGESLLYKFNPTFKVFHWTGENLYFIKGNPESLSIGAGDGKFGLWLDGDLNLGRSSRCSTYGNEPLAPQEDFVVKTLECWAFV